MTDPSSAPVPADAPPLSPAVADAPPSSPAPVPADAPPSSPAVGYVPPSSPMPTGAWPLFSPAMTAPARSGIDLRRLLVPIVWEAALFLATVIAVAVVFLGDPSPPLDLFLAVLTPIGLLAVAVALSLRTATPNLAVGALAILAAAVGVSLTNESTSLALGMIAGVLVAGLAGLVLAVISAALSVPAWAVTLGGAAIIEAAVLGLTDSRIIPLRSDAGPLSGLWFLLFVALTLGGGALFLLPGVRVVLSATRDIAPVGRWGGLRPGLGTVVGLTGSGFIAGIAGVVYALRLHSSPTPNGTSLTLLGLAIALLGGVGVFGRLGGVTGVLLATLLLGSVQQILALNGFPSWVVLLVTGIAVLIGLVISRLVETLSASKPNPGQAQ